jgi:hypothetical protein
VSDLKTDAVIKGMRGLVPPPADKALSPQFKKWLTDHHTISEQTYIEILEGTAQEMLDYCAELKAEEVDAVLRQPLVWRSAPLGRIGVSVLPDVTQASATVLVPGLS